MLMRGLCVGLNIQIFWVSLFLWAHSLVEKFCGELKKQFEQPFPPIRLAKTSSRVAPSPPSYESYTKKEKKEKPWMNVNEKMVMVFDNKNIV